MNKWTGESMNHWTNEPRNQWINEFCQLHPPKVTRSPQFFVILKCKSNSGYSLVRILPASSSKSVPMPSVFCNFEMQSKFFEMQIELSLQSRAHFANIICQKCSEHAMVWILKCKSGSRYMLGFYDFNMKSSSGYSLVHILLTSFSKNAPSVTVF